MNHFEDFKTSYNSPTGGQLLETELGVGLKNTIIRLWIFYKDKEYFNVERKDDKTIITIGGTIVE